MSPNIKELKKRHDQLIEECNKIKDQLTKINGVLKVGIGFKIKKGKVSTETGITVFVEKKYLKIN